MKAYRRHNKKGLSEIVTTVIIILLVLVALGIIWGVLSNLLNKVKEETKQTSSCIGTIISIESATKDGTYNIWLTRETGGTKDAVNEVALIFYDVAGTSKSVRKTLSTPLRQLESTTLSVTSSELGDTDSSNRIRVEVVPIINGQPCSTKTEKEILTTAAPVATNPAESTALPEEPPVEGGFLG